MDAKGADTGARRVEVNCTPRRSATSLGRVTKACLICALVLCVWCGRAQDTPAESLSAIAELNDAINWTSALRDPIRRLTNRVVTTYAMASLGAVVCPVDKGLGADYFREAVEDLNSVPDGTFHESKKVLPVATFSGLWKTVMGLGKKCDPRISQPNEHSRERRESEHREAPSFLGQARVQMADDPDRATQLAQAALEAGDPYEFDISSITSFLNDFRERAPDLADDVYQRAIGFTLEPEVPNVDALAGLGDYLFQGTFSNGKSGAGWQGDRDDANPDLIPIYIGAVTGVLVNESAVNIDPATAYALAYQLLPKARELGLVDADALEKFLAQMQTQNSGAAAAVDGKFGTRPAAIPTQSKFRRLMTQIMTAVSAGRFAEARELLTEVDGVTMRSLTGSFIDFGEAAYAVRGKDSDRAMALAGKLPSGVKRALLYAGIVATAENRVTAIFALHLGLKDADLLSYEQRMGLLPALATASSGVDRDETQAVLSLLIASLNDANTNPRKIRFDPRSVFGFDGPRVLLGPEGFLEVVQGNQGRQNFPLKVTGVGAYSFADLIAQAKGVDFMRLQASVETLRSELQLTKGYVALAKLRMKVAKAVVAKAVQE